MTDRYMARKMFDEGVAAYIKNDFRKSVRLLTRAIKMDHDFAAAYVSRGAGYLKLEKINKAVSDFDQAIQLNPNYARVYHLRGLAHEKLGDVARAFQDFDRAIEIDPDFGAAYRCLDAILTKNKRPNIRMEDLEMINHLTAMRVAQLSNQEFRGDLAI